MLRLILIVIAIVVLIVLAGAIIRVAVAMLGALFRIAAAFVLAVGAGSMVLLLDGQSVDDSPGSLLLALLIGLAVLIFATKRLFRERDDYRDYGRAPLPEAELEPAPVQPPPPREPDGDENVGKAWEQAADLLPRDAARLNAERAACARLLRAASINGMDAELRDCAVLIRRHVPDLVAHTAAMMQDSDRAEHAELGEDLAASLTAIAARAREAVDLHRSAVRDGLAARHAHVRRDGFSRD